MKLLNVSIAFGILAFGSVANAAILVVDDTIGSTVDGTDVGFVDGLIVQETITGNSNPTTETAWANQFISGDAEYVIKTEDIVYYSTTESNIFAFELASDGPDYFLVKNARERALFRNAADIDWGVFDASLFTVVEECKRDDGTCTDNQLINIGEKYSFTISHVAEINGDSKVIPSVPVPAAVWLFASGLIGLVAVGRRKEPAC